MSKLSLTPLVRRDYDQASLVELARRVEQQGNQLAEGAIAARHGAMTSVPTAGTWVKGDLVDNSAPAVVSSSIADYIIVGWICTASGVPGTWKERRVLIEDITAATPPTLGTEVASTSGTSIDFTGIPSWVTQIEIMLAGVSTNGNSVIAAQIGDAGGIENAGYLSSVGDIGGTSVTSANSTASFELQVSNAATVLIHGSITLTMENASQNRWVLKSELGRSDATAITFAAGSKATSAALDRVRITTAGGVDTFDAGVINIRMS